MGSVTDFLLPEGRWARFPIRHNPGDGRFMPGEATQDGKAAGPMDLATDSETPFGAAVTNGNWSTDPRVEGELFTEDYRTDSRFKAEEVDLINVVAGQATVDRAAVSDMRGQDFDKIDYDEPPIVVRSGDYDAMVDGHHRAVAASFDGRSTMKVLVLDISDQVSPDEFEQLLFTGSGGFQAKVLTARGEAQTLRPPKQVDRASARVLHTRGIMILERAFEIRTIRSLRRVLKSVSGSFGAMVSAAEPDDLEDAGWLGGAGEAVASFDDLAAINSGWATEIEEELIPALLDTFAAGAQNTSLSVAGVIDIPEFVHTQSVGWMADAGNRLARVSDEAWEAVRSELTVGLTQGESIDQLQRRIRGTIDVVEKRARTIARTEVIGAVNAGSYYEAKAMGVETKTWLATDDKRTRPTHNSADGQIVDMDEMFVVGGVFMRFPHDPAAPSRETVNCRCTNLYDHNDLCMCVPGWAQSEADEQLVAASSSNCGCSGDAALSGTSPDEDPSALAAYQASNGRRAEMRDSESEAAINYYVNEGYLPMNKLARGMQVPAWTQQRALLETANLDAAFQGGPSVALTSDAVVHRVVRLQGNIGGLAEAGNEFIEPGFLSTSTSRRTVEQKFARPMRSDFPGEPIEMMEITIPKGTRVVAADPMMNELVLPRNTKLRTIGRTPSGALAVEVVV